MKCENKLTGIDKERERDSEEEKLKGTGSGSSECPGDCVERAGHVISGKAKVWLSSFLL